MWYLRNQILVLVSLVALAGCVSQPRTTDEIFDRQVLFTISKERWQGQFKPSEFANISFVGHRKEGFKYSRQIVINGIISRHKLKKVSQWSIKSLGLEAIVAEFRGNRKIEEVVSSLEGDERIESVQRIKKYKLLNYNDPFFHVQNSGESDDLEKIHRYTTGKDVFVGIVDTGVDRLHPELQAKIAYSANFVDHDQHDFDIDEHGTTVAGVIGSAANNDLGIVGVAPDSRLMIFKSCSENDQTRRATCDSFSLLKALEDVLAQEPDILNLSLAGPEDSLLTLVIQEALEKGIVVIAAVDSKNEENTFPASIPGVLAVNSLSQVDAALMPKQAVVAPGLEVLTTTPGSTYAFRSGSSMSTAFVSGIAALMKERTPQMSAAELIFKLRDSAQITVETIPLVDICHAVIQAEDDEICARGSVVLY